MKARSLFSDFWIFEEPVPSETIRFRLFEAYVAAECLAACSSWASYIAHVEVIAHPLGLAHYVPLGFLLNGWLPWVNASAIGVLLLVGFLRVCRGAYALALGLMLFQYAARYSLGEIPHSSNLIGMFLLGFALGPLAFRRPSESSSFSVGFAWFSIGSGYFSAAVCKLVATGPDWPLGEHLTLWIYNKAVDAFSKSGDFALTDVQQFVVDHRWAGTLFLGIGLVTELMAPLVWHRRFRRWVLAAIVGLHLGIDQTMGIFFRSATLSLAILAIPAGAFEHLVGLMERLWPARRGVS